MTGSGSSNDLTWSASQGNVAGYNVESAPSSAGPWSALTGAPTAATAFSDATPAAEGPTFYRVTTSAVSGSVSDPAGPVSITRKGPAAAVVPSAGLPAPRSGIDVPLLTMQGESVVVGAESESVLFSGPEMGLGGGAGLIFGVPDPSVATSGNPGSAMTADGRAVDAGAGRGAPASESASDGLLITADPSPAADDTVTAAGSARTGATGSDILWLGLVIAAALSVLAVTARWRPRVPSAGRPRP